MISIKPLWDLYIDHKQDEVKKYYNKIKDLPRYYVYDTTYGAINSVYYIKDLKYSEELITFYEKSLAGENPSIPFPIIAMPYDKPLIVVGYSRDSLLVEVVDFNTSCWGYIKGYVYRGMLHPNQASIKLIEEKIKFWAEKEKTEEYQRTKQITGSKSAYGVQCD